MIIYRVTNLINDKIYIGQTTTDIKSRWRAHCNKGGLLFLAIQKYGKENFKVEEIAGANSLSELNYLEEHFIFIHNCIAPNGYNILPGGRNSLHTEDTRQKMRKPKTGNLRGEHRKRSLETRAKISQAHKGKKRGPMPAHLKAKLLGINKGARRSEESRKRMSERQRGRVQTQESKSKRKRTLIEKGIAIAVYCIELARTFVSIRDAAIFLGNANKGPNIYRACEHNRPAYGMHWRYA